MDLSILYQIRSKRFWWLDVMMYFVIALLVATIFCYIIFSIKSVIQIQEIKKVDADLQQVGTADQKAQEKEVLGYRKKITDFNNLFKNHKFAANIFSFMQAQTMPYVWFKQFSLDPKTGSVQLSGVVDNMDGLSRQVQSLEKNKYITKLSSLNLSTGSDSKISFSFGITLDKKIFNYISDINNGSDILENVTPSDNGI